MNWQTAVKTYTFAVLSMVFWAMSFVWIKIVFKYYNPLTIIFLRLAIASIILIIITPLVTKGEKIKKADYPIFLFLAFTEPFCYFLGESFGMQFVSSTLGAVIISTIPLFTPFAAYIFFREGISIMNFLGLILSFAGIVMMVINRDFSFAAPIYGIGLVFFAVLSALVYSVLIKRLVDRYRTFTIIKTQSILGALYFLPLFLIFDFSKFAAVTPTVELVTALLQLTIFASLLAFFLYIPVIKKIGIIKANVFANMIPVFTAIFSYFILDEQFTSVKILGMTLVVAGLMLSQVRFRKIEMAREAE